MARIEAGMPTTNTHGNTRDNYTLIQVLTRQLSSLNPVMVSTDEAVTLEDGQVLLVTTGSVAALVITLPAAADSEGVCVTIKKVDAGTKAVTLTPDAAEETIDEASTLSLPTQYDVVTVQCDGPVWHVISSAIAAV